LDASSRIVFLFRVISFFCLYIIINTILYNADELSDRYLRGRIPNSIVFIRNYQPMLCRWPIRTFGIFHPGLISGLKFGVGSSLLMFSLSFFSLHWCLAFS
jgi:hypothetical protein